MVDDTNIDTGKNDRQGILSINPGTTTTRCGFYQYLGGEVVPIAERTLNHDETQIASFAGIADQLQFRAECVNAFLEEVAGDFQVLAFAGRGGMLPPVPSGTIEVCTEMAEFLLHTPVYHHASNLGAPLANEMAARYGVRAFVVDPVSVDEFPPVARVSGHKRLKRFSFVHALNIRACGRRLANSLDKPFESVRAVVAHLGAGFSIAALGGGKLADNSNRMESSPFSPERWGGLPPLPLIELCYSGEYEKEELLKELYGRGGVYSYLGTKDIRKVEEMISEGNEEARLIMDAMLYQVSKSVGAMASVANFDLDGIILTGGIINSPRITGILEEKLSRLAPVYAYPGSDECLALAEGAARVLSGAETPMTWPLPSLGEAGE